MDETIYNLIESPDPKDRKRAVKMLAQDGSQEAIKVLSQLYKQETDPEIKDLAVKAGQYIKKQQQAAKWEGSGRTLNPEPEDADDTPEVEVSSARQTESKALMDQALDYLMQDNRVKAIANARKAFQMNPNLRRDPYYMGVANEVTGRDTPTTIEMLMSTAPVGGKEKAKRKNEEAAGDDGWGAALTDLAIYGLVNAAIIIVGMLLFVQLMGASLREAAANMAAMSEYNSYQMMQTRQTIEMLSGFVSGAGIVTSVVVGLITGVGSIISLLIQLFFIHIAATMVLGGEGTFPRLIRKVTNFLTIVTVLSLIVGFVAGFLWIGSIVAVAAVSMTSEAAAYGAGNSVATITMLLGFGYLIASLVVFYLFCNRIGQAYDFGAGKGCLSIIIASIMLSALSCVLNLACSSVLQQAMMNAMMNSSSGF